MKDNRMRIEALTFFRFLAAITVVFFHFGARLKVPSIMAPFLTLGPEMVTFFFALSGFVMMVASSKKEVLSAKKYYLARIARIYPVYLLALIWACTLFYGHIFSRGYGLNNLKALFLSLTLTQSWLSPYPLSLNDPAWSLSVEAFFYLCFPLLFFMIRKSEISGRKFALLAVAFYAVTQVILSNLMTPRFYAGFPSVSHDLLYYFPLSHFCSFILGVAGGHIFVRNSDKFHKPGAMRFLFFGVALLLTTASLHFQAQIGQWVGVPLAFDASFYSLLFIVLVMSVAYSDNLVTRFLSLKPFVLLGNASYALYILQKPAFTVFQRHVAAKVGSTPEQQFAVFIAMLITISIAAYYLVEKPGKKLVFRLISR